MEDGRQSLDTRGKYVERYVFVGWYDARYGEMLRCESWVTEGKC